MNYDSKKQFIIIFMSIAVAFLFIYGVKEIKFTYFSEKESTTTEKITPKPTKPIETTTEPTTEEITTAEQETEPYQDINLTFAGNIKIHEELIEELASNSVMTQGLYSKIEHSDFSMFNLQTAFATEADLEFGNTSTNYTNVENKIYFKSLGFNGAALANNYIMECGPDTISSTMLALDSIGIYHTGAGNDYSEASKPIICQINGKKITILSTSRSYPDDDWIATDKNIFDYDDTIGILAAKDTTNITELITQHKETSDLVIVYMNCGNEGTDEIDSYQQYLAHTLVDAGADLIIGCSPDKVQSIEYYDNTPIVYSLGTFINAESEGETALLSVTIAEDNSFECSIIPCYLENYQVSTLEDKERPAFFKKINALSKDLNAVVSEDGTISKIE